MQDTTHLQSQATGKTGPNPLHTKRLFSDAALQEKAKERYFLSKGYLALLNEIHMVMRPARLIQSRLRDGKDASLEASDLKTAIAAFAAKYCSFKEGATAANEAYFAPLESLANDFGSCLATFNLISDIAIAKPGQEELAKHSQAFSDALKEADRLIASFLYSSLDANRFSELLKRYEKFLSQPINEISDCAKAVLEIQSTKGSNPNYGAELFTKLERLKAALTNFDNKLVYARKKAQAWREKARMMDEKAGSSAFLDLALVDSMEMARLHNVAIANLSHYFNNINAALTIIADIAFKQGAATQSNGGTEAANDPKIAFVADNYTRMLSNKADEFRVFAAYLKDPPAQPVLESDKNYDAVILFGDKKSS